MGRAIVSVLNQEVAGSRVSYAPTQARAARRARRWRPPRRGRNPVRVHRDRSGVGGRRRDGDGWARRRPAQPRRPSRRGRRCRRPPLAGGTHRTGPRPRPNGRRRAAGTALCGGACVPGCRSCSASTVRRSRSCPVVRTWLGSTSIWPSTRGCRVQASPGGDLPGRGRAGPGLGGAVRRREPADPVLGHGRPGDLSPAACGPRLGAGCRGQIARWHASGTRRGRHLRRRRDDGCGDLPAPLRRSWPGGGFI